MKKRLLRIGAAAILVLLVLAGAAFWYISRAGSGKLEQWIGSQLQSIANSYINPTLSFEDLDYTYPSTVSLKNLRLTADDPANPGKKLDVIACGHASLTLAEIPSMGKPIVIEKIELDQPLISAVATGSGSKEFVGFSNIMRDPSTEETPDAAPTKLSDAFRMRLVQLTDGKIVYDPRIPGTVPMTLDQITTTLAIEPTSNGWYKLGINIARKPVFEVAVDGQLDLDAFTMHDADIKLMADLGGDKLDYLPPELQQLLKQYDAKGKLTVGITGTMPAMDAMKGDVTAHVQLSSAHVAMGDFRLPIENVDLNARFADGKASLTSLKVVALGGSADLSGAAVLNDRLDANLSLKVRDMVLENLLKQGPGPNAAKLSLDFNVAGSLMAILGKAPPPKDGPLGAISLKDFRLWADDPVNPGQTIDVVAVKNLDVALAEPVVAGKPIVIEKVILDRPVISAVAVSPESLQIVGIPSLPPSLTAPTTAPSEPVAAPPTVAKGKLSDAFRVKAFQLVDAKVIYDPRIPNTQRMWLDGINTTITADAADPGLYVLSTKLGRKPIFDIALGAKINIDQPAINDLKFNLLADLTQNQTDFLVPQLQALLKSSQAKGKLTFNVAGSVPLNDLSKARVTAESALEQINVVAGADRVPVESFKLSAELADGNVNIRNLSIGAVGSTFNLTGAVKLNDRLDTSLKLKLDNIVIEQLLATIQPRQPWPKTATRLNGEIELNAAVLAALGGVPLKTGEPLVGIHVRNFRLSADDALAEKPLDFLAVQDLAVKLSALPVAGRPIVVDSIAVTKPAVRAVALAPGATEFIGLANLQRIAAAAPNPPVDQPAPAPALAAPKLSSLARVNAVDVTGVSLYYDPRIEHTVPMAIHNATAKVRLESPDGELYSLIATANAGNDLALWAGGKLDIDALHLGGMKLNLFVDLGRPNAGAIPPQLQTLLKQYNVLGTLEVNATGEIPLADALAAELMTTTRLDKVGLTAGGYRIPIDSVRLPVRLKDKRVEFLPAAAAAGAPMVSMLAGTIDLTGTVLLDDHLTAPKLDLVVRNIQLKELDAAKIERDPNAAQLIGLTNVDVNLVNAPLLVIAAHATPPDPNRPAPSPLASVPLPAEWGHGQVRVREARLAGLELVQGMANLAKNVFADAFNQGQGKADGVKPVEHAEIDFHLQGRHVRFDKQKIIYEGELVAVEGEGTIGLDQTLNLTMRGGPLAKLGGLGKVGSWMKEASNSLLTYEIGGTVQDFKLSARGGDGKPIREGAEVVVDKTKEGVGKGVEGLKKGIGKLGDFIGGKKE